MIMAQLTLLLLRPFASRDRELLFRRLEPFYKIIEPSTYDNDSLSREIKGAQLALGNHISQVVLESASQLRMLQILGAGLERIDMDALATKRVIVCRSTSHARQVAEHVLALLLGIMRKISLHDRLLRNGVWYRPNEAYDDALYQTDSLQGAKVGLLGFGAINQAVASMLAPFNVELKICARNTRPGISMSNLNEIMSGCDVIIVAVPLTENTRNMIGAPQFAIANPGLYIINVARAEIIERSALHDALRSKTIRGVALDVPYGGEDVYAGLSDFILFDNALLSPHRAGTLRGYSPHLDDVIDNLIAYAKGQSLKNIVNFEVGY